jgi:pimeloyl-ACP methyl ester carboxylesterase
MRACNVPQGRHRYFRIGLAVPLLTMVIVASGLAACAGSSAGASTVTVAEASNPPPAGLPAFYATPEHLPGGPGTLIKYQRLDPPGFDGTQYQVMYVSENEQGHDIPVVGTVTVPRGPAPAGGFPVLTYAHPTVGLGPGCTELLAKNAPPIFTADFFNPLLRSGYDVAISDMQPAGKTLPFLVGTVAARNVIDIVRAARQLPAAHASDRYAVWGHSEGGQAAMFALKIAPSYAPDLHLTGVVASAPPAELQYIYDRMSSLDSSDPAYWMAILFGLNVAYGSQAPLGQVLTPLGLSLKPVYENECAHQALAAGERYPWDKMVKADPFSLPAWKKLLLANDPGLFSAASPVPLLILHGGDDTIVPPESSKILAAHLCATGQDTERWVYPGMSHPAVVGEARTDMLTWLKHRFAGGSNPDPMTPTDERGISVTRCA